MAAPTQFSIIGTAGRKVPEGFRLSRALFNNMVTAVEAEIRAIQPDLGSVHLVSGASAWADHVAVVLYLTGRYKALTLYMPAIFDFGLCTYADTGDGDWRKNPGRVSNFYMQRFNAIMGDGFHMGRDIKLAYEKGAHLVMGDGFHARNNDVAKSQVVIALTWSTTGEPDDGGTKHTWSKVKGTSRKIHVGLRTLVV